MPAVELCDESGAELHEDDAVYIATRPDSNRSLLIHGDVLKELPQGIRVYEGVTRSDHDGFNIHRTVYSMGLFEPDDFVFSLMAEDAKRHLPNITAILCP